MLIVKEKLKKVLYKYITNLHRHNRVDKCSMVLVRISEAYTHNVCNIQLSLNGHSCALIKYHSSSDCIGDTAREGIAIYNRYFFCGCSIRWYQEKFIVLYELIYEAESNTWKASQKEEMIVQSRYVSSLASAYNTILLIVGKNAYQYDIALNKWKMFPPVLSEIALNPCVFCLWAKYLYVIGGKTTHEEITSKFDILDITNPTAWIHGNIPTGISIYSCKSIQSSPNTMLIIGCESKTVWKLQINQIEKLTFTEHDKLLNWDSLDECANAVFWEDSYHLVSSSGIYYRYSFKNGRIQTDKGWIKKMLHIEPYCIGG